MKKQIILLISVVVLLVSAFYYKYSLEKDDSISIEIGIDKIYGVEPNSYEQYYNALMDQAVIHVKGKVESIDCSYDSLAVIKLIDDTSEDELTIYTNNYPKEVTNGCYLYVNGMIQPDINRIMSQDREENRYIIDTESSAWMNPYVSLEESEDDYLSVAKSLEKARMIYEKVFFEIEGEIVPHKTLDGRCFYSINDGNKIIQLFFRDDLDLKEGDHVTVLATATSKSYVLYGRQVKSIASE